MKIPMSSKSCQQMVFINKYNPAYLKHTSFPLKHTKFQCMIQYKIDFLLSDDTLIYVF